MQIIFLPFRAGMDFSALALSFEAPVYIYTMNPLNEEIAALETHIPDMEMINLKISGSSVGWHISHSLLALTQIIERLKQTRPENYKWGLTIPKLYVMTLNRIPRGKARAPKAVVPESFTAESLYEQVQKAYNKIEELKNINTRQYFEHPYLGHLRLKQTIKFLRIHTRHHLKIIRDITRS